MTTKYNSSYFSFKLRYTHRLSESLADRFPSKLGDRRLEENKSLRTDTDGLGPLEFLLCNKLPTKHIIA